MPKTLLWERSLCEGSYESMVEVGETQVIGTTPIIARLYNVLPEWSSQVELELCNLGTCWEATVISNYYHYCPVRSVTPLKVSGGYRAITTDNRGNQRGTKTFAQRITSASVKRYVVPPPWSYYSLEVQPGNGFLQTFNGSSPPSYVEKCGCRQDSEIPCGYIADDDYCCLSCSDLNSKFESIQSQLMSLRSSVE